MKFSILRPRQTTTVALIPLASLALTLAARGQNFVTSVTTTVDNTGDYSAYAVATDGGVTYLQSSGQAYGPQMTLNPSNGSADVIKNFSFSYYCNYNGPTLTWTLYANDGAADTHGHAVPSTVIDSDSTTVITDPTPGTFVLNKVTISYSYNAINTLPQTLTLAVQFDNGGNNANIAGLQTSANSPSPGSTPNFFWQYNGSAWTEHSFTPVPEPASSMLVGGVLLGGAGLLALRRHAAKTCS